MVSFSIALLPVRSWEIKVYFTFDSNMTAASKNYQLSDDIPNNLGIGEHILVKH